MSKRVKTALRKAVDYLINEGIITKDKDLLDAKFKLGLNSPGTLSAYIKGNPSVDFVEKFQNKFDIKLSDFEDTDNALVSPKQIDPIIQLLIDSYKSQIDSLRSKNETLERELKEARDIKDLIKSNFAVSIDNQWKLAALAKTAMRSLYTIEAGVVKKKAQELQDIQDKEIHDHLVAIRKAGIEVNGHR